jgi:hypothetical protein
MAAVVEEVSQDPWDDLPEEVACEIVSKTTNLKEILKYMRTSRKFLRLAQNCILFLDSDKLIEVPVQWLLQFRNLRGTGDLIRIILGQETIPLVAQLPQLREANFIIRVSPLYLDADILNLFFKLKLAQKLPRVNFRLFQKLGLFLSGLLIQGGQMVGFGDIAKPYILQPILDEYPNLNYVDLDHRPWIPMRLVDRDFRDFVEEAEFGLIDPSRPPGPDNPSITPLVQKLVRSGSLEPFYVGHIIFLYSQYHHLTPPNRVLIEADRLLRDYLGDPINLRPIWDHLYLSRLHNNLTVPQSSSLHRFDVPQPLSSDEYDAIIQQIDTTSNIYRTIPAFYREDGTIVSSRPSAES